MESCKLSVVFPTFNRPDEVKNTLGLLSKNLSIPYEVFILDNSPEPFDFELSENEHYHFVGKNLGTASRNIGIKMANAPYTLLLDDDSHPLPGAVETAIAELENASPEIGGITSKVERPDGGLESPPLLPTAFHGCGVLFRTEILKSFDGFYPEDFCFYGEEYWSTLKFYRDGFRFKYLDAFRVCHRMSGQGRDKAKILYYLTLNNRRTWKQFVPESFLAQADYDTLRRYELICHKEGVEASFEKAMREEISVTDGKDKMSEKDFRAFSLLDAFKDLLGSGKLDKTKPVLFCGCGKFPVLWAEFLEQNGIPEVLISDFNSGLIGQDYGKYRILSPDEALGKIKNGFQAVYGHSSRFDSANWVDFLKAGDINKLLSINL
jgi:GT2 family glycosyltransferase